MIKIRKKEGSTGMQIINKVKQILLTIDFSDQAKRGSTDKQSQTEMIRRDFTDEQTKKKRNYTDQLTKKEFY